MKNKVYKLKGNKYECAYCEYYDIEKCKCSNKKHCKEYKNNVKHKRIKKLMKDES